MNPYEKEVQRLLLQHEKSVLQNLEKQYTVALRDVKSKLMELELRNQTQSVIYQLGYHQQLEQQIGSITKILGDSSVATIDDFLQKMYTDGYVGINYGIAKQGLPITTAINQDMMIQSANRHIAGMTFADRTYMHMNDFKQTIKDEITIGLAGNMSYDDMARRIANSTEESLNNSYRIARTEGHRTVSEAKWHAMLDAEEKGANILKEWSSALDPKTRDTHQRLDGQMQLVKEPFEVDGISAMYPGGFGLPEEDINCRCILQQRATWALDDDTRERMAEIDGQKQLINARNYGEYKEKYLRSAKSIDKEQGNVLKLSQARQNELLSQLTVNVGVKGVDANLQQLKAFSNANGVEQLRLLDSDGNVLFLNRGTVNGVSYTPEMMGTIRSSKEHSLITMHNHPGSSSFSSSDISNFLKHDSKKSTYVIGSNGTKYELHKGADTKKRASSTITKKYNMYRDELFWLDNNYNNWYEHSHAIIEKMAEYLGLVYKRTTL